MSVLTYNGVTLPYCFHTSFRQEALYDDLGHTDWYSTKFDITVQAVINKNYAALLGVTAQDPASMMGTFRRKLLAPRQALSVKFNGVDLIPSKPSGNAGNVDTQNGPFPQSCDITLMTNTTFLVNYHIITYRWETSASTTPNNVLFNRWTETMDIDQRNYTTRTRHGKMMIRSDNPEGWTADQLRSYMCVTGVPPGFVRQSSQYTVDPSGLALSYTIVDKEVFWAPPKPAYQAEGYFVESGTFGGAKRIGEVHVTLHGSKESKQEELIDRAIEIGMSKLILSGVQLGAGNIQNGPQTAALSGCSVKFDLYENSVTFSAKALLAPIGGGVPGVPGRIKNGVDAMDYKPLVSAPVGSDPGDAARAWPNNIPNHKDYGSANLLLQAAKYWDPSLAGTKLLKNLANFSTGKEPGQVGKQDGDKFV